MLHTHAATLARIERDPRTLFLLQDYFDLPRHQSLTTAMLERGLGQADVVLALSHFFNHATDYDAVFRDYIERFIGHPITMGPPCLTHYRDTAPYIRIDQSPRITYVRPSNPRLPNTDAFHQWDNYKVGRSIAQLISRGITRRDVRRLVKRGWIKVSA